MIQWIKNNSTIVITSLVTIGVLFYIYGCEPKVRSLIDTNRYVNRQEFQLELDRLAGLAQIRMVSFDRQERLRAIILENALILVQGQPLNPFSLITGVAAIYGVITGGYNIKKVVKVQIAKRKVNNGKS